MDEDERFDRQQAERRLNALRDEILEKGFWAARAADKEYKEIEEEASRAGYRIELYPSTGYKVVR